MNQLKDRIIIQDNFFSKKMLDKIKIDLSYQKFVNRFNSHKNSTYQKIYFHVELETDHFVVVETIKNLKKKFNLSCSKIESKYFLSSKHEQATPHNDGHEYNCLIYLKGNHLVNNGTGFYDKISEGEYQLNTHVGFKENRAIVFDSKIHHTSLQFNEGSGARYCLANFIN
jgi:hypothetical protein|tara:strand:+ start:1172 stop:1681 length:510 start_codon:yes stop_codon:yes gene_type:complete